MTGSERIRHLMLHPDHKDHLPPGLDDSRSRLPGGLDVGATLFCAAHHRAPVSHQPASHQRAARSPDRPAHPPAHHAPHTGHQRASHRQQDTCPASGSHQRAARTRQLVRLPKVSPVCKRISILSLIPSNALRDKRQNSNLFRTLGLLQYPDETRLAGRMYLALYRATNSFFRLDLATRRQGISSRAIGQKFRRLNAHSVNSSTCRRVTPTLGSASKRSVASRRPEAHARASCVMMSSIHAAHLFKARSLILSTLCPGLKGFGGIDAAATKSG